MNMKRKKTVLVCITGQKEAERLLRQGKLEALEAGASLHVLCVSPVPSPQTETDRKIFEDRCQELETLRQAAKQAGAEMTIYFYDEPALVAAGFAQQIGASRIITGVSEAPAHEFVKLLHQLLPKIPISMVSNEGTVYHLSPPERSRVLPAAFRSRAELAGFMV